MEMSKGKIAALAGIAVAGFGLSKVNVTENVVNSKFEPLDKDTIVLSPPEKGVSRGFTTVEFAEALKKFRMDHPEGKFVFVPENAEQPTRFGGVFYRETTTSSAGEENTLRMAEFPSKDAF